MNIKKQNLGIELMRFVFAVAVLFHHGFVYFYDSDMSFFLFRGGWIGVEFFLFVSGFLMAKHVLLKPEDRLIPIEDTSSYMIRRIKKLFPIHLLCFFIMFIEHCVFNHLGLRMIFSDLVKAIPEMLLIQMSGLQFIRINANDWYLSALLLCSLLLYPLLRKLRHTYSFSIAPIMALLLYGILFQCSGKLTPSNEWIGIFMKGTLRAFAGMNLGIFSYELCQILNSIKLRKNAQYCIRFLEILIYFAVLFASCIKVEVFFNLDAGIFFVIAIVLSIAVVITFSRWSVFYHLAKYPYIGKVVEKLGGASLYIYISQRIVLEIVWHLNVSNTKFSLLFFIIGALILGFLLYYLFENKNRIDTLKGYEKTI